MKILLLGNTGNVGSFVFNSFAEPYMVVGKNSKDFSATSDIEIEKMIIHEKPDIVMNCVAYTGINECRCNPDYAFLLNAHLPYVLSTLSNKYEFLLFHFSSSEMFYNITQRYAYEDTIPNPKSIYGYSKYMGDRFVIEIADRYYIFRLPQIFGDPLLKDMFVEKIIHRIDTGEHDIKIVDNMTISLIYLPELFRRIKNAIEEKYRYGLYHVANVGSLSLFDITKKIKEVLYPDATFELCGFSVFYPSDKSSRCPLNSHYMKMNTVDEVFKKYFDCIKNGVFL